ncbi:MAG: S41 family peptidase [Pseudomonadota bacterium]
MTLWTRIITALAVGVALTLALLMGERLVPRPAAPTSDAGLLREVIGHVQRDYVDPVDDQQLLRAAVRGIVADLDAHSAFLDEREFADVRSGATGRYSGVGLELTQQGETIIVMNAMADSPAGRAGVQHGDVVAAIDGIAVAGLPLTRIVRQLRGPAGSSVTLGLTRAAVSLEVELVRDEVVMISARHRRLPDDIGYLHIRQFHERTTREVQASLSQLQDGERLQGLVIDLRNNPGGLLDAAVEVADLFLDSGVIVSARGRTADARFSYTAAPGTALGQVPIVILVNGASASGAEILAGALRDHDRAVLLGTSTFGKGLVQTVMPLSDGQAIKLSTSRYYTPAGDYIHERGLTPDIVVQPGALNTDAQLQRAVDWLRNAGMSAPAN